MVDVHDEFLIGEVNIWMCFNEHPVWSEVIMVEDDVRAAPLSSHFPGGAHVMHVKRAPEIHKITFFQQKGFDLMICLTLVLLVAMSHRVDLNFRGICDNLFYFLRCRQLLQGIFVGKTDGNISTSFQKCRCESTI
jgi:hypothetical protein